MLALAKRRHKVDINKVWISGVAVTEPLLTILPTQTALASFTIQINEDYRDREGRDRTKANYVRVECLGKAAESVSKKVKKGGRCFVDGYIRQDTVEGRDMVAVRAFAVYKDKSLEGLAHREGLKQALELIETSRDKASAIKALEVLLATG